MTSPLLSIIVPSYNQGQYLERALQSVLQQTDPDWEMIVMDGGSRDQSAEIIRRYEKHIRHWQSEPDGGQSAAINAGFDRAEGQFLTWLNSDDMLLPGTVATLRSAVQNDPSCHWWVGGTAFIDVDDVVEFCAWPNPFSQYLTRRGIVNVGGPSAFFSAASHGRCGDLRTDLDYSMDTEYWHRMAANGYAYKRFDDYVWAMRLHGEAKTSGHLFSDAAAADPDHPSHRRRREEAMSIRKKYAARPDAQPPHLRVRLYRMLTLATIKSKRDSKNFTGRPVESIPH